MALPSDCGSNTFGLQKYLASGKPSAVALKREAQWFRTLALGMFVLGSNPTACKLPSITGVHTSIPPGCVAGTMIPHRRPLPRS